MIFLIAGTKDGRKLAEFLSDNGYEVTASVVSEYGRKILEQYKKIKVNDKKLNSDELTEILAGFNLLVDASHPYASNISLNAMASCKRVKIPYIRYERADVETSYKNIFHVSDYEEAAKVASKLGKNIFITTGSRNIQKFVDSDELKNCNLTVRVLPSAEVLTECEKIGLTPKQIIAMQGPFSTELNIKLFEHTDAEVVVTKNSGQIGGADTKIEAAEFLNLPVVMIDKPKIDYPNIAVTFNEVLEFVKNFSDNR